MRSWHSLQTIARVLVRLGGRYFHFKRTDSLLERELFGVVCLLEFAELVDELEVVLEKIRAFLGHGRVKAKKFSELR